jgi:transposase
VKYALLCFVTTPFSPLPTDLASAHAMILAQREMLEQKQSELTLARSDAKVRALEIERLKLLLAKARREHFGQSSECGKLLVEQLELAIDALELFLRERRALLSANNDTTKAINYVLNRWRQFTRFLDDGRVCLSNNAAERGLRGVAVGRRNWTFAGSDEGGRRAASVYTLIETTLCRARHSADYADRRTMPSGFVFPRFLADRRLIGSA